MKLAELISVSRQYTFHYFLADVASFFGPLSVHYLISENLHYYYLGLWSILSKVVGV